MKTIISFLVIMLLISVKSFSSQFKNNKILDLPIITTDKVPTMFCAGNYLEVSFQASSTFTTGNVFTVQLSDKFGDFTSPIDIGTLSSDIPGIIYARIPKNTDHGLAYRIRVISSAPGVIGSDNGDNITINSVANTTIIGDTIVCNNVENTYSTIYEDNVLCLWKASNGKLLTDSTAFNVNIEWDRFSQNATLTLSKTNTGTNCSDTSKINIYIKEPPVVDISWGDYNVCQGETISYSAASSSISVYHWEVQGGVILGASNLKDVDVQWNSDGIGYILLRKANQFGCVGEEKKEVLVNPRPIANIIGNNTGFSGKTSVYYTDYADSLRYLWQAIGGEIQADSTFDSLVVKWGDKGQANITLLVANKNTNCTDTSEKDILIKEAVQLSAIQGNFTPCAFSIEEYTTENPKNLSIKWSAVNGEILGADNGNSVQVHWSDTRGGDIQYIAIDLSTNFQDSVEEHININSIPSVSLGDLANVCEKDEPFKLSGGAPEDGNYSGDGVQDNKFYPSVAGLGEHIISYTFTNKLGCSNTATNTIFVNPSPQKPTISDDEDGFFSSADYGNQWFKDGLPIPGATGKKYKPTESGAYTVQVTDNNGCKSEMSEMVLVGVNDTPKTFLDIYPNPSDGNFILKIPDNTSGVKIYIYNILGNLVFEKEFIENKYNDLKLELNNLNSGIYVINIYFSNKRFFKKLIINK